MIRGRLMEDLRLVKVTWGDESELIQIGVQVIFEQQFSDCERGEEGEARFG